MNPAPAAVHSPAVRSARSRTARTGWSSIERQLPLLLWVLLVPTVAVLIVWVHTEMRADLLAAAGTRMEGCAHEVGAMFEKGVAMRLGYTRRAARRDEFQRVCVEPSGAARASAESALDEVLRGHPGVAEIRSPDGAVLARAAVASPDGEPDPALAPDEPLVWPTTGHQPLRLLGDRVVHEVVAGVVAPPPDGTGQPADAAAEAGTSGAEPTGPVVGYLVLRRLISASAGTEMLARLVGSDAHFVIGNRSGDLWTNLEARVDPPPVDPLDPGKRFFTRDDGSPRIGAGIVLKDSPWLLWVESDGSGPLQRSQRLLLRLLLVGGVLVLLGGVGAWWISRRVTVPLREATCAAEAMAAGDYARRLPVRRRDEVGRLTEAFNAMAEQVEQAHGKLETRVAARTADLRAALQRLRDAQDELVRGEKLATLGQLAGSVGHELRNPLGVMSNAIYYLDMIAPDDPAELREYLGILRRQISLSEKIIGDLLDFTRGGKPQCRAVDVRDVVAEQVARLGVSSSSCTVDLDSGLDGGLPRVWADPVQVGQILFNLLTNAVQALDGRADGRITVAARVAGETLQVEVADSGKGIAPEVRDKVFEPLFTTRARGIGLGLAVSRRLARNCGGDLWLADGSRHGGATFVLALPIVPAAAPVGQPG